MALSAAAVAPSMGKYTVSWVAFLITILNVRLGRWLPHPLTVVNASEPTGNRSTYSELQIFEKEARVVEKRRLNAEVGSRNDDSDLAQQAEGNCANRESTFLAWHFPAAGSDLPACRWG